MSIKIFPISLLAVFLISFAGLHICDPSNVRNSAAEKKEDGSLTWQVTAKPFARYWWFASEIEREDVRFNLDWLKKKGFWRC